MSTSAQIVLHRKRSGRDSSRLVIIANLCGRGSPLVLFTEEKRGDNTILRLPGGEAHKNETPRECAHRERIEETGIRQSDLDTELKEAFVRKGKAYNVHVFYCGIGEDISGKELFPTDEKIKGLFWANLTEVTDRRRTKYLTQNGLELQKSHYEHLQKLRENHPHYLRELYSCVTVQKQAKSAS